MFTANIFDGMGIEAFTALTPLQQETIRRTNYFTPPDARPRTPAPRGRTGVRR
jgi:hypothetical protein